MKGTMMTPRNPAVSVTKAEALPAAQQALAMTQPAALQLTQTLQSLMSGWAMRTVGTGVKTVNLAPFTMDAQVLTELFQLQYAIVQRLQAQQQEWMQGWTAWLQERAQVKRANTMSKLVEQELDLFARYGLLVSNQLVDLVTLQENIEVNTGYWVAQTLTAKMDQAAGA
ncbi:hypothetical protein Tamer19_58670 [Cupriavidus sp. TA19]|uniref:hypothetical protein n=1 Tax=unclassified Cupriavidus TaxID=2640874 RepID=UPI000E2F844E|nr:MULTISPECIES: hypothetical protein [unclassified Cupriavidus]BDB28826.1 hypothetical protein CTP10_R62380 [Cupriavidus sp. P-10]GLC96458.1 hypothetical protein Tamer19_58670 [Cupriavidus sp. TA19]